MGRTWYKPPQTSLVTQPWYQALFPPGCPRSGTPSEFNGPDGHLGGRVVTGRGEDHRRPPKPDEAVPDLQRRR
jgi:hypothetical protein